MGFGTNTSVIALAHRGTTASILACCFKIVVYISLAVHIMLAKFYVSCREGLSVYYFLLQEEMQQFGRM